MSRVYRSIDAKPFIKDVDIQHKRLESTTANRPVGGFHGAQLRPSSEPVLSLVEQQELKARNLLDDARRQAEEIQREAYQAGFEEGDRAGRKMAMQKVEPALQTLNDLLMSISGERHTLMQQHEQDLIKIAFLIASKVIHKQLEMEPEVVAEVIAAALHKVPQNQRVTVQVAPQDLPLLEQLLADGEAPFLASDHVTLEAEAAVGRGGCRILTETGDIDATIDGQLRVFQGELW